MNTNALIFELQQRLADKEATHTTLLWIGAVTPLLAVMVMYFTTKITSMKADMDRKAADQKISGQIADVHTLVDGSKTKQDNDMLDLRKELRAATLAITTLTATNAQLTEQKKGDDKAAVVLAESKKS